MIVIGLTGSIAMGKSTTARLFESFGIPVFDSDAEVHRLYQKGGAAVKPIAEIIPDAVKAGEIDRKTLGTVLAGNPALLPRIEAIVHPLVYDSQRAFLERCEAQGFSEVVLDVPLLFETGRDTEVDKVVVVAAPAKLQRKRALKRIGMSAEKFALLLGRQIPDEEKRRRADYVIDTSKGIKHAREAVKSVVENLRAD